MTYSRETRAEAMALVEMGETAQRAAERLNIEPRAVQRWAKRCREISAEQEYPAVIAEHYRLVRRYQACQHDALDTIEEDGSASKYLSQLIVGGGVSTDKVFRDREAAMPQQAHAGPLVIIVGVEKPELADVIEGELVEGGVTTPPIPESVITPTPTRTKGRRPGPATPDRAG